jgi:endonuclease III
MDDKDAMKELLSCKYIGPKSASVVMNWCLKRVRTSFTVDTTMFRIAGLWGWRPLKASRENTQAHLNARIPKEVKFDLHFLLLAHGRACPTCRGGSKSTEACEAQQATHY